ncbi:hypothetical protein Lal_00014064 [Lupinus albus]|nr:hypothetical protein Lal_00014064 [Lupinus albus]
MASTNGNNTPPPSICAHDPRTYKDIANLWPLRLKQKRSTSCQTENESLENDAIIEGNSHGDVKKESIFDLHPVEPFTSGEGLPYAPQGWPNHDDIWGWKVGRRTNKSGFYCDRYLLLPKSLFLGKQDRFQSKTDVERYVKTNFPNMELDAFFALFSWKVPSTKISTAKGKPRWLQISKCGGFSNFRLFEPLDEASHCLPTRRSVQSLENGKAATEEIATDRKLKRKAQLSNQPTRKSFRHVHSKFPPVSRDANASNDVIDLSYLNEKEPLDASIAENFDDYLNNLEDILVLPKPETETSLSDSVVSATTLENEITECRKKLSSLLSMDFPSLVSSNNVVEAAKLASQLRKDPSLSVDQLIKLKLVEEMLLLSEAFVEAKGDMVEADKFFAELEAKKLKVPCLKNEYNELKDKVAQIEAEIERSSKAIEEVDVQILQLESKRSEMSSVLETAQKKKAELSSNQTMLAKSIPTIVSEIQHGYSEKRKWVVKKAKCAKRIAEIQERFSSLRGLTF